MKAPLSSVVFLLLLFFSRWFWGTPSHGRGGDLSVETGSVQNMKSECFSWLPFTRSEDGGQGRAFFARRAASEAP
jgi:hypothetical protein